MTVRNNRRATIKEINRTYEPKKINKGEIKKYKKDVINRDDRISLR